MFIEFHLRFFFDINKEKLIQEDTYDIKMIRRKSKLLISLKIYLVRHIKSSYDFIQGKILWVTQNTSIVFKMLDEHILRCNLGTF